MPKTGYVHVVSVGRKKCFLFFFFTYVFFFQVKNGQKRHTIIALMNHQYWNHLYYKRVCNEDKSNNEAKKASLNIIFLVFKSLCIFLVKSCG